MTEKERRRIERGFAPYPGYAALKDALDAACGESVLMEDKAESDGDEDAIRFAEEMYKRLTGLRTIVERKMESLQSRPNYAAVAGAVRHVCGDGTSGYADHSGAQGHNEIR